MSHLRIIPNFCKYDVFISFRGMDTRKSFTSHLHEALRRRKIAAYVDEETLERGEEISSSLLRAISESKISLIIFSENYASSTWCLDELVHILECKNKARQIVIPVFHGVDPSHVRKQEGCFGQAFVAHQRRFKDNMERVEKWRAALEEASGLAGWNTRDWYESKLIEKIVDTVSSKLDSFSVNSDFFKYLIGMEKCLNRIEQMLCLGLPDVRMIGIWGMGGIGKTTIAVVLYHKFCSQFDGSCFLENIWEESQKKGLPYLRDKMFSELLEEGNLNAVERNKIHCKKVLIVLDGVDSLEQVEYLAGDHNRLGSGSRIIVTAREKQVLNWGAIDGIYEVEMLDYNEALQMFYLNAFGGNFNTASHIPEAKSIVDFSQRIPLALIVLGASLRSRTAKEWKSTLNKLKNCGRNVVGEIMRVGYDGLSDMAKAIFLRIACEFIGQHVSFAELMLGGDSSSPRMGIEVLIRASLISIRANGKIWMHDLIREMAWRIVHEKTEIRYWPGIAQDHAYFVMKNRRDSPWTAAVASNINTQLRLMPPIFPNRYLNFYNPLKSSPSKFQPHNFAELEMPCSELKQFWKGLQDSSSSIGLLISYEGQWRRQGQEGIWSFDGQRTKGITVSRDITYHELVERLYCSLMVDPSQYDLDMRFLVNSAVHLAPIEVHSDEDVKFFISENSCTCSLRYPLCVTLVSKVGQHLSFANEDFQSKKA